MDLIGVADVVERLDAFDARLRASG